MNYSLIEQYLIDHCYVSLKAIRGSSGKNISSKALCALIDLGSKWLGKETMHVYILQTSTSLKGVSVYLLARPCCSTNRRFGHRNSLSDVNLLTLLSLVMLFLQTFNELDLTYIFILFFPTNIFYQIMVVESRCLCNE